jgi:glucose-6-phosphate isomerase
MSVNFLPARDSNRNNRLQNSRKPRADGNLTGLRSVSPPRCARDKSQKSSKHLGKGWIGFNFARGLGIPVRVVNDAALQALGSYRGGQMLFLGLGTGLGSALAWDNILMRLNWEICHIDTDTSSKITSGFQAWRCWAKKLKREVAYAVTQLRKSFVADYVVLGGGLVHRFGRPPEGTERGQNENAFLGGIRLWETKKHSRELRSLVL